MLLALISGVSGSGKTVFLRALEDIGFYCVDNLPIPLLVDFVNVINNSGKFDKAAVVIDVRERNFFPQLKEIIDILERYENITLKITFLDARKEILERRYSETRRKHPVDFYNLEKSFEEERELLKIFRKKADFILDTSDYTVYDLRRKAEEIGCGKITSSRISIKITSFGYKYGLPSDVDIVFDMRFLPNPHYIPELKDKTGKDWEVKMFIKNNPLSAEFIKLTRKLVFLMLEHFDKEGKNFISLAFGCTGGRHRSVYIADVFYKILKKKYQNTVIFHRDVEK